MEPNKQPLTRAQRIEQFLLDPQKAIFLSMDEFTQAVNFLKEKFANVDISSLDALKPQKGTDYFTEDELQAIEQFIMDRLPKDAELKSYLEELVTAAASKIQGAQGETGPQGPAGKDGTEITTDQIRDKIAEKPLEEKHVKGLAKLRGRVTDVEDSVTKLAQEVADRPVNVNPSIQAVSPKDSLLASLEEYRYGFSFFTDLFQETSTTATDNGLAEIVSGASAAVANQPSEVSHLGIARATSGTTATGRAALFSGINALITDEGAITAHFMFRPQSLSTVAERFQILIGLFDTTTAVDQSDGIYFLYDEGGVSVGSTAAAYFQTVTSSNATRTFNTGLTQVAVSANAWSKLTIETNSTGTQVIFKVNGVKIATHTANIPVGAARTYGFGAMIVKSIGTTARTFDLDYVRIAQVYNTLRD